MKIICKSKKTKDLSKTEINNICKLKNKHWNFGLKSQLIWFKKNTLPKDCHYQIFTKKILIGYLHLGERIIIKSAKHKNLNDKYILFRNLIIDKNFRNNKFSKNIMDFANNFIKKKNKIGFLLCKKKLINFYLYNHWVLKNKKNIDLLDHPHQKFKFMVYNFKETKKIKINYKF